MTHRTSVDYTVAGCDLWFDKFLVILHDCEPNQDNHQEVHHSDGQHHSDAVDETSFEV